MDIKAQSITEFKFCPYTAYYKGGPKNWNGKDRILLCDIEYLVEHEGHIHTIVVPQGFVTDLGSIPGKLRSFVDDNDVSILAFILHDYLFHADCPFQFERKVTDLILKSIMEDDGQSRWTVWKTYRGVRLGSFCNIVKYHDNVARYDLEYVGEVLLSAVDALNWKLTETDKVDCSKLLLQTT